ncbi:hypothetical protein CAPTEDRAFT_89884 [Capitella teleta]|uniref:Metallo-beta-lactamase domain-containing protein n=1 Tax=Capitella teleta TaxID=283909 RepID=R7TAU8_CAPTE|nr:hypothetical protein CAPTEDRAFT_89884 [Capitella teleta]|eukprot:ELT90809.1 hypothetical protein CAPTEDRAFT_89884 [Capitella teleta]
MSRQKQDWFLTRKVADNIYLTTEEHFFEFNRCNIWLIKGPTKDVIIDTGLGVCNLKKHYEDRGLISRDASRPSEVICTHVHFDHSGGAHHFDNVFIHELDLPGLKCGQQVETLNYVRQGHFHRDPYPGFSACSYRVPSTDCQPLTNGDKIDLGDGQYLDVMHYPGHTKGSIVLFYPQAHCLFTGDFVYDTGDGAGLLDWLPNSSIRSYKQSAESFCEWLSTHDVNKVYPGHGSILTASRTRQLLLQYLESKDEFCGMACATCLRVLSTPYFRLGCFRCILWC